MKYLKYCRIRFSHQYFKNHLYDGLSIVPTSSCIKTMNSYGLLLKKIGSEYLLIYKEKDNKSMLTQLKEKLVLSFTVFCEDAFLLNYSGLSVNNMNEGFLLTNAIAQKSPDLLLHKNEFISEEDKIVIVTGYNTLRSYVTNDTDAVVLTYLNATTNNQIEFFNGIFKDLVTAISFKDLIEYGRFSFEVNTSDKIVCYALEATAKRPFGVLQLCIDPSIQLADDTLYTTQIGSRQAVWRYHIVNREQVDYKDFKIFFGKNAIALKPQSQIVLGTGESAYLLETSETILLAERYENMYELEFVKSDVKTGQTISKKRLSLPVPETNKIKVFKSSDGLNAYSDMYIYL